MEKFSFTRHTTSYKSFCTFFLIDQIIDRIKEAGFRIVSRKDVGLTKELAGQFYHEHEGKEFFNGLTDYMSRFERKQCSFCNIKDGVNLTTREILSSRDHLSIDTKE